jgi:hypothetical protein
VLRPARAATNTKLPTDEEGRRDDEEEEGQKREKKEKNAAADGGLLSCGHRPADNK